MLAAVPSPAAVPTPATVPTPVAVPTHLAVPISVNSGVAKAEVTGNVGLLGVNPLAAGLPLV